VTFVEKLHLPFGKASGQGCHTFYATSKMTSSSTGFGEQSLGDDFRLLILALAEDVMPDAHLRIDEI
jgi:hypothetical protein